MLSERAVWLQVDSMMRSDTSAEVVHACVAVTLQREEASVLVRDAQLVIDLMLRLQVCVLVNDGLHSSLVSSVALPC
jgi:hypothetical protein